MPSKLSDVPIGGVVVLLALLSFALLMLAVLR
ncbi:MAG: hypothetical protein ACI944_001615 [Natronomonas sp.]|jgi:hypothetical protein